MKKAIGIYSNADRKSVGCVKKIHSLEWYIANIPYVTLKKARIFLTVCGGDGRMNLFPPYTEMLKIG